MIKDTLFVLWLLLPAGLANMAPVLAKRWGWMKAWDKPLDAGKSWRGKRILGDHKTLRGILAGFILALALSLAQFWLYNVSEPVSNFYRVDISGLNPLLWAAALTLGALGGDAIKSFFKRRAGIAPGKSWVPFDQIDFVAGTLLAASLLVDMPLRFYVIALFLGLFLHPLVNLLGWALRIKENPF